MSTTNYITAMLSMLISVFLVYKVTAFFLTISEHKLRKLFFVFGCMVLVDMVIFIGDPVNLPPTLLIFLLSICLGFQEKLLHKLAVGMILSITAFSFNTLVDTYLYFRVLKLDHIYMNSFVRTIFWLCMYVFFKRYAPDKSQELPAPMWRLIILLTLPPLGTVLVLVLLTDTSDEAIRMNFRINAMLLLLAQFSVIGLLAMITALTKQQKLEQRLSLADINQRFYETMEQQQFEVRRLKHDMNNHLQTISVLPEDEREDYISRLIENASLAQRLHYCADATVNAVLSSKVPQMEEQRIAVTIKAEIGDTLPMDKVDICAVFANALDNAIEASMKLTKEERSIALKASMKKGLFVLQIENACQASKDIPAGAATTKEDKKNHGFGLRSVREVALRYNGKLELGEENGVFTLLFYIPLE